MLISSTSLRIGLVSSRCPRSMDKDLEVVVLQTASQQSASCSGTSISSCLYIQQDENLRSDINVPFAHKVQRLWEVIFPRKHGRCGLFRHLHQGPRRYLDVSIPAPESVRHFELPRMYTNNARAIGSTRSQRRMRCSEIMPRRSGISLVWIREDRE